LAKKQGTSELRKYGKVKHEIWSSYKESGGLVDRMADGFFESDTKCPVLTTEVEEVLRGRCRIFRKEAGRVEGENLCQ
jgi:hypothetical protein